MGWKESEYKLVPFLSFVASKQLGCEGRSTGGILSRAVSLPGRSVWRMIRRRKERRARRREGGGISSSLQSSFLPLSLRFDLRLIAQHRESCSELSMLTCSTLFSSTSACRHRPRIHRTCSSQDQEASSSSPFRNPHHRGLERRLHFFYTRWSL